MRLDKVIALLKLHQPFVGILLTLYAANCISLCYLETCVWSLPTHVRLCVVHKMVNGPGQGVELVSIISDNAHTW